MEVGKIMGKITLIPSILFVNKSNLVNLRCILRKLGIKKYFRIKFHISGEMKGALF